MVAGRLLPVAGCCPLPGCPAWGPCRWPTVVCVRACVGVWAGVCVCVGGQVGDTVVPLQVAAGRGSLELVQLLLARGGGGSQQDVLHALSSACFSGDPATLAALLERTEDLNAGVGTMQDASPLIVAAGCGRVDLVDELIRRGADVNIQRVRAGGWAGLGGVCPQPRRLLLHNLFSPAVPGPLHPPGGSVCAWAHRSGGEAA